MKRLIAALLGVCLGVSAQSASFPGSVATDSQLKIAANNLITSLKSSCSASDSVVTVGDASRITAGMLLTIEREIVSVSAISGNNLTVSRGFDGTAAVSHLAGRNVAAFIDAWHHNALASEVKAIETALGAGLANISANSAMTLVSQYTFTRTPGGSLTAGITNSVTLTPCPTGVNGTDTNHPVYISGGTGSAESVTITGGTCTSGASSGTILFTPANNHSGAWTVSSATQGQAEFIAGTSNAVGVVPPSSGADQTSVANQTLTNSILLDLRSRASNNTRGYFTLRRGNATPELTLAGMLPPPYTQNQYSTFTAGSKVPAGSVFHQENAIVGTCDNYAGTWPANQAACVGIVGIGVARAANSPAWGANFLVSELPGQSSPLVGIEIDMGVYTSAPNAVSQPTKHGLQITNVASASPSTGITIADINAAGSGFMGGIYLQQNAVANGGSAFVVENRTSGTARAGLDLGTADFSLCTLCVKNNNSIVFGAGVAGSNAQVYVDPSNTTILKGAGGDLQVKNGAASTTNFTVTDAGAVYIPAIKSNSGTRYVCVDSTGHIVSQTTACSGT
jgi:hypothetical protein